MYLRILKIEKHQILKDYYLRTKDKCIALSNRSIYHTWKNVKSYIRIINLKHQFQHGMKNCIT